MIEVNMNKYAPLICSPDVAEEAFNLIMKENPIDNEIVINMGELISLSVQSINIIFGKLYDKLGADKFHENIILHGCSKSLGDFISFIINERNKIYGK